ncbi:hypothetical protein E5676_scaffold93G00110 [Cucumis melo var. makuwa]|uniref:Uncharacterized protein n=1 Tax=Cucumis melo var. makuwa TaxID=1194695 RepID=A0A5D3DVX7_CUCMM|nr:hypothetical protein E5676_scaffold93G00110 [Cucumis melo var. makuwa]
MLAYPIRVVHAWVSFGITTYLGLPSPMDRQSGIDINMIRVIRRDRSQPDRLCVSSEYATYQFILSVPYDHRRPDFVPTGSHDARVRERASSWTWVEERARASWRATRSDRGEP